MNIYTYATTVYHMKDTCQSSYNAFIVTYNRINIITPIGVMIPEAV